MRKRNKIKINFLAGLIGVYFLALGETTLAQNFGGMVTPEENKTEEETATVNSLANPEISQEPLPEAYIPPQITSMSIPDVEPPSEYSSNYTLGASDIIEIVVLRHPEVSGQFVINNEGKIQYDFVGDVELVGLTKQQVKDLISEKLSTYIVSPEVNVKIVGYNSKVVYVIGEVGRPGKIYMRGDTITVRDALIEAGLPLLSASTKKSRLITPSERGNALRKTVDVNALLVEGDLRENLVMKPGDTLYIPPTIMAKTMRMIQPVAQPIQTGVGAGRDVANPGF